MNGASLGDVVGLGDARIDGFLDLSDASAEHLDAPSLRVGENLDLRGARISKVILGDAVVDGYIKVGAKDDEPTIKELDLHNARAGSLLDNGEKSWPTKMRLDGFTFSRFGEPTMAARDRAWWDNWAHSDESKSSYPYEQLAAAHAAAGDRDAADAFHYAERVRAAENAGWGERTLSYVLHYVAGYGIGYYMFNALWWALGLALLGAMILRWSVQGVADHKHGIFWCFGASVDRLLPFITLKKEFSEFFDNKEVNGFTLWQDSSSYCLVCLAGSWEPSCLPRWEPSRREVRGKRGLLRPPSRQLPPRLRLGLFAEHFLRPILLERLPHQVLLALGRHAADRRIAVEIGREGVALCASRDGVVACAAVIALSARRSLSAG